MGVEVMVGAAVVNAYGQYKAGKAEEKANRQNAAYYREQKKLQELATRRELDIFKRESSEFIGEQVSIIARSGVSLSGSALMALAGEKSDIKTEAEMIRITGARSAGLTELRARQSDQAARDTKRIGQIQTIGSALNVGATYYDAQRKFGKPKGDGGDSGGGLAQNFRGNTPDGGYSGGVLNG